MTPYEAEIILEKMLDLIELKFSAEQNQAIAMAISALEKQDAPDINVGHKNYRQAVIDVIEKYVNEGYAVSACALEILHDVERLPPAQPERKKGKKTVASNGKIEYLACDQCGEPIHQDDNFCPNCGAKMDGRE